MSKYKNLKLNPNNKKQYGVATLKLYKEDYEKIKESFEIIFTTVKMFYYDISVYRKINSVGRIIIRIEQKGIHIRCEITHINNKITGISIEKKQTGLSKWKLIQSFYYGNMYQYSGIIYTQEEMILEILKFL